MARLAEVVMRERGAVVVHRASLRGRSLPPPSGATKGTFLHGFLLPFALIVATMRDRELRRPYLKITCVRLLVVAGLTALAWKGGTTTPSREHHGPTVVIHRDRPSASVAPSSSGILVDLPGLHVDLPSETDPKRATSGEVRVLGQSIPVEEAGPKRAPLDHAPKGILSAGWAWMLALFALVSSVSTIVIALSRRYDDWLGWGVAGLASIRPEDAKRKEPKIAVDFKWLKKKLGERIRETVVFVAGLPVIALFLLVPNVGPWLFKIVSVLWGYYWLGVFTAAKNDHALADAATAPPPQIIRGLNAVAAAHWWTFPLRWYGRLWVWLTKSFNSPAAAFERSIAAFLGLALARAILSLPGLYLLQKAIVPVAAGRLIAEGDPHGRFYAPTGAPEILEKRDALAA